MKISPDESLEMNASVGVSYPERKGETHELRQHT